MIRRMGRFSRSWRDRYVGLIDWIGAFRCTNGVMFYSGNSRSFVTLVGRKRMPGTSRGSPRWKQPKTPSATSASGRTTTRAMAKREKHHRNSSRNCPARRRFLLLKNFRSISFFFSFFSFSHVFLGSRSTLLYCNIYFAIKISGGTIKSWRLAPKREHCTTAW